MLKLSYDNFSFMLLNYYTYFKKGNVGANTSNIYRFNMKKKSFLKITQNLAHLSTIKMIACI